MFCLVSKASLVLALVAFPAWANELSFPQGDVILTVTNSELSNSDGAALLDLAMLEELDSTTIETTTIWTEGLQTFEGVSLHALVAHLGIEGEQLSAIAINDYAVEIPMSDAIEGGPIIAYKMNGDTMSIREKGPLWVIYPYDSDTKYQTEVVYSRSIWQLDRLEVVE